MTRRSIDLPPDLVDQLTKVADAEHRSINKQIVHLLTLGVKNAFIEQVRFDAPETCPECGCGYWNYEEDVVSIGDYYIKARWVCHSSSGAAGGVCDYSTEWRKFICVGDVAEPVDN